MNTKKASRDLLFVSITENADAEGGPGALQVAPIHVERGDTLPIAGRSSTVDRRALPAGCHFSAESAPRMTALVHRLRKEVPGVVWRLPGLEEAPADASCGGQVATPP